MFSLEEVIRIEKFERIKRFSDGKETPLLVMDLDTIEERFDELARLMPGFKIYYAVKANPMDEIIQTLKDKGSSFDIATVYELDQLLRLGVNPDRISFGSTIKKAKDIKYAYDQGIKLFVTDSIPDIMDIANNAPGSKVVLRFSTSNMNSEWPLGDKFGSHNERQEQILAMFSSLRTSQGKCGSDMVNIFSEIIDSKRVSLYGLSFHVGSQKTTTMDWEYAIGKARDLFNRAEKLGIELKLLNIGGGFPANYLRLSDDKKNLVFRKYDIREFAATVMRALQSEFGDRMPELIVEPGRSLVGDAGVIVTEVIRRMNREETYQPIPKKDLNTGGNRRIIPSMMYLEPALIRWVYIDIGVFGGLAETLGESIRYPIFGEGKADLIRTVIAGPTCDSMDTLYRNAPYYLRSDIKPGDRLFILTAGAYTQSYSSVGFNGIPPLKAFVLPRVHSNR
ncbi:MAG: type III PLP-dependent enzyme [archaeon]